MAIQGKKRLLEGKICLVTGATSGIGKETAFGLAREGGTVVIVARNPEKGSRIVQEIKDSTGNPHVDLLIADLSRQADVRNLATQFRQKYAHLHVLVNDAGGVYMRRQETADGIEMTFGVNHLAGFFLTNLLLDILKASAPSRIINVSSAAHLRAHLDLADLQGKKTYSGVRAYGASKLAILYFTYELARRLEGTYVTVNALHPGFVRSNFARNNRGGFLVRVLSAIIGISVEKGARTSIYLATSPEVEHVTGKYFVKCKAVQSNHMSYDRELARRLWEISEELTGLARKGELAVKVPVQGNQ